MTDPHAPDTVFVERLPVTARVGVTDAERATPQRLDLALTLATDHRRAAATDDVADTLDYAALRELATRLAAARPYRLLETLAETLARETLAAFPAAAVTIRIEKPAVSEQGETLGITLTRSTPPPPTQASPRRQPGDTPDRE